MQIENNRYAYLETDCDLEFDSDYQRLNQDLACLDQTIKMTNDLIKTVKKLRQTKVSFPATLNALEDYSLCLSDLASDTIEMALESAQDRMDRCSF